MRKFLTVILYIIIAPAEIKSQIFPKENSILNYRLIGFSFSAMQQKNSYKLEIADGNYSSQDSFKRNIIKTINCETNRVIVEVPAFGRKYTWRVISKDHNINKASNSLHHFSTCMVPAVDTNMTRVRVLENAKAYKDAYFFLDGSGALYDMAGHPVWYLPDIGGYQTVKSTVRDLKLSVKGTITYSYEQYGSYEIDYNGAILWKAPDDGKVSGGNSEYYHHEFTRLGNGHYMILGAEYESWNQKLPSATDSSFVISHTNETRPSNGQSGTINVSFGTVIEYDEKGNVAWSWKSSDYFRLSDIYYHAKKDLGIVTHENSFYFDEKRSVIYIGFRNISRILKVKYPEGTVLNVYGEIYKPNVPEAGNGLFRSQHSVRYSDHGYLYLYNNNTTVSAGDSELLPEIVKLEEPDSQNGQLKKIWEYKCTIDGVSPDHPPYQFQTGGNVIELPDQSLFVNMSNVYSKVFIVSPDKKILWSAIPEKWNEEGKRWDMISDYRASIIANKKDLENLIWNSEKNN